MSETRKALIARLEAELEQATPPVCPCPWFDASEASRIAAELEKALATNHQPSGSGG